MPQSALTVAHQPPLFTSGPLIIGPKEFTEFRDLLTKINDLLLRSGCEGLFVERNLALMLERKQSVRGEFARLTAKEEQRYAKYAVLALRCNIAGYLTKLSTREFSIRLAESEPLQRFCGIRELDRVVVPSKSRINNFRNQFPEEMIRKVVNLLGLAAACEKNPLGLAEATNRRNIWIDCTCLKANVHFPVDWVLLKDAVRTIAKSIATIRRHGLKHRMPTPESFLRTVNAIAMQMHHARGKLGAKKVRKRLFRKLKKVAKTVESHGQRYVALLKDQWEIQTDFTKAEAEFVITRIQNVLDQLPTAIEQAHRRIIQGKLVKNKDKILSLYDPSMGIIKRGKSNAEMEFGNEIYFAEQVDGLIVDWKLYAKQPPAETTKTPEILERLKRIVPDLSLICSDRGFYSAPNVALLEGEGVKSALCPRNPEEMRQAFQDDDFRRAQKRRGSNEARMGIVKNIFVGNPVDSRVLKYKECHLAWAILTHNLWVAAKLPRCSEMDQAQAA
jgi:hypothetical protein